MAMGSVKDAMNPANTALARSAQGRHGSQARGRSRNPPAPTGREGTRSCFTCRKTLERFETPSQDSKVRNLCWVQACFLDPAVPRHAPRSGPAVGPGSSRYEHECPTRERTSDAVATSPSVDDPDCAGGSRRVGQGRGRQARRRRTAGTWWRRDHGLRSALPYHDPGRPLVRPGRIRRLSPGAEIRAARSTAMLAAGRQGKSPRNSVRPAASGADRGGGSRVRGRRMGPARSFKRWSTSSSSTSTPGEPAGGASRCSTTSAA